MTASWTELGTTAPDALVDARLELHWAAQIPASVGYALLTPRPDWSHVALTFDAERRALVSGPLPGSAGLRVGLVLAEATLFVAADGEAPRAEHALAGTTLTGGFTWLTQTLGAELGSNLAGLSHGLKVPDHELPPHPVGTGAPFGGDGPPAAAARAELARWFANADVLLQDVASTTAGATPVRTWPHHFDSATLVVLDQDRGGEEGRSINVGLSPGDGSYAEPYFYVTPWPAPTASELPELEARGAWHRDGWTGAVLRSTDLVDDAGATGQAARARDFIAGAIDASRGLVG